MTQEGGSPDTPPTRISPWAKLGRFARGLGRSQPQPAKTVSSNAVSPFSDSVTDKGTVLTVPMVPASPPEESLPEPVVETQAEDIDSDLLEPLELNPNEPGKSEALSAIREMRLLVASIRQNKENFSTHTYSDEIGTPDRDKDSEKRVDVFLRNVSLHLKNKQQEVSGMTEDTFELPSLADATDPRKAEVMRKYERAYHPCADLTLALKFWGKNGKMNIGEIVDANFGAHFRFDDDADLLTFFSLDGTQFNVERRKRIELIDMHPMTAFPKVEECLNKSLAQEKE